MAHKRPLTATSADRLLDLLCGDDAFRACFSADPSTALAQYGLQAITIPGACALPGLLASKEEFAAVRETLQQAVTHNAIFSVPHFFHAGDVERQLKDRELRDAA